MWNSYFANSPRIFHGYSITCGIWACVQPLTVRDYSGGIFDRNCLRPSAYVMFLKLIADVSGSGTMGNWRDKRCYVMSA